MGLAGGWSIGFPVKAGKVGALMLCRESLRKLLLGVVISFCKSLAWIPMKVESCRHFVSIT